MVKTFNDPKIKKLSYDDTSIVYLIDFGLSKRYLKRDNVHIQYKLEGGFIGTPSYISMNAHMVNNNDDIFI